jgi:hypothetical protein
MSRSATGRSLRRGTGCCRGADRRPRWLNTAAQIWAQSVAQSGPLRASRGLTFLKRDWAGPAAGVFFAVGLVVAIGVAGQVLVTGPHFGQWQSDVILALETAEAVLLILAGLRVITDVREPQTGESQPPESRSLIGD